jgi:hypothetical protein
MAKIKIVSVPASDPTTSITLDHHPNNRENALPLPAKQPKPGNALFGQSRSTKRNPVAKPEGDFTQENN